MDGERMMKNVAEIFSRSAVDKNLPAWVNMRHAWKASDAARDRGLEYPALGEIHFKSIFLVLWKEFRVSILCGITLAAANFVKLLLFDLNGQENAFMIALVISLTLVGTIIMAKLVGSSLPLLASKVGFDPAVMANPLISTVCDSLSLLIYFGVAKLILHL